MLIIEIHFKMEQNSMDSSKQALRSGIAYTVASFLAAGMSFITTPIFARVLSKEEFGIYNNFVSWLNILSVIITIKAIASFISARYDYRETFNNYIFSIMGLTVMATSVGIVFVNLFSEFFTKLFHLDLLTINLMFIYIFFSECIAMYQNREQYYFRYKRSIFVSLLTAITTTGISIALVFWSNNKLLGRLVGYTIPSILIGAFIFGSFALKNQKMRLEHWKYAIPLALPYVPHLLSLTLLNSMDRIMITKICGAKETALYSLAYTCSSVVTILMSSMNSAYGPWLAGKLDQKNYQDIRKFSYVYIGIFMLLVMGIILIAPEILFILGGKSYEEAKYVMPPVMMGCAFQLLYTMHVNIEQFKKRTIGMAIASAVCALFNYGLNLFFIPSFGYIAAAYTTLASYLLLLLLHMFLVYRIKIGAVYNNKFLFSIVGIGISSLIPVNILYSHTYIRYIIVLLYMSILVLLIYKNINKINKILRK